MENTSSSLLLPNRQRKLAKALASRNQGDVYPLVFSTRRDADFLKSLLKFFLVIILGAMAGKAIAQAPDPVLLSGNWSGTARFFNIKIQNEQGSLPVDLLIQPDLSLSGKIGSAIITSGKPIIRHQRIDYVATLNGPTRPTNGISKAHLVLLITQLDSQKLTADFHLKNKLQWDSQMVVGVVEATRRP